MPHWIVGFFTKLDTKDWITLVASLSAFTFSAITYFQKRVESTQTKRKQLTEILKEITELNMKDAMYRNLADKSAYPTNYIGLLADQRRFFVRQAAWLSDRLGALVSSYELNVIAITFDAIDLVEDADRFFTAAIRNADNDIEKGIAVRNYARFLFMQGRYKEARKEFQTSIDAFSFHDHGDRPLFYRGDTYGRWAEQELSNCGDVQRARELYDLAAKEYEQVKVRSRSQAALSRINESIAKLPPETPTGAESSAHYAKTN